MLNKKMMIYPAMCLMALFTTTGAQAQQGVFYNIKDHGAKGDGIATDTKAINETIIQAAKNGGGTVIFPAGKYLSATIHLQSHITLYLDQGAVLIAAARGYDLPEKNDNPHYQDYGHSHFNNSLIIGSGLNDIAILGPGKIWGKGLLRDSLSDGKEDGLGNKTISLKLCRNVTLRDFTIEHGGWFGALLNAVDNLTIDNVTMDTDRDGIDVISCKNVRISNCLINSPQDDAICLKSDYALGYARATENVLITNCQVSGYDEGTLLDGTFQIVKKKNRTARIKLGTESNGGFKNITISNCIFDYSRGLALETVDGGLLEDITITNINMHHLVNSPLFIRLGERMRGPANVPVGKLRRVIISNINAYDIDQIQGALIIGTKNNPIEDLTLNNIHFYFKGGGTKNMTAINVPELEKGYPDPTRYGPTPSYGFFIRHVRGLRLYDIKTSFDKDDARQAFVLDDVENASLNHIDSKLADGVPLIQLRHVKKVSIKDSEGVADTIIKEAEDKTL
jgi:polygalacturonase